MKENLFNLYNTPLCFDPKDGSLEATLFICTIDDDTILKQACTVTDNKVLSVLKNFLPISFSRSSPFPLLSVGMKL